MTRVINWRERKEDRREWFQTYTLDGYWCWLIIMKNAKQGREKPLHGWFILGQKEPELLSDIQVEWTSKLIGLQLRRIWGLRKIWKRQFQGREVDKVLMVVLFFFPVITFYSEWKMVLNVPSKIAWRKIPSESLF